MAAELANPARMPPHSRPVQADIQACAQGSSVILTGSENRLPSRISSIGLIDVTIITYSGSRNSAATLGLFGTLPGVLLIHTQFGMPVMTLLFRNYYAGVPRELFMAARIDGGGFWRIFVQLMLPMSLPIVVVAMIMQVTAIWNDFLLGLVFAGREWLPMTVQLNNIINTTTGERLYNVNMAATLLTSLVPLTVYLVSGRWFVRGIAAGAVKG